MEIGQPVYDDINHDHADPTCQIAQALCREGLSRFGPIFVPRTDQLDHPDQGRAGGSGETWTSMSSGKTVGKTRFVTSGAQACVSVAVAFAPVPIVASVSVAISTST